MVKNGGTGRYPEVFHLAHEQAEAGVRDVLHRHRQSDPVPDVVRDALEDPLRPSLDLLHAGGRGYRPSTEAAMRWKVRIADHDGLPGAPRGSVCRSRSARSASWGLRRKARVSASASAAS